MIKTTKKEFTCSSCEEYKFEFATDYSKLDKEICRDCAYAQKRHDTYFNAGQAEQFYNGGN